MATEFVNGLRVFAPREGAPEFVKANLVINAAELTAWLAEHAGEDGTVRVDVLSSKNSGKWYCSKNTYKAEKREPDAEQARPEITADDIPW